MAQSSLKPFAQAQHKTAVEVNKQSIARKFSVSADAVAYMKIGLALDNIQVVYDPELERTFPLPAGIPAGAVVSSYANGVMSYTSEAAISTVDLNLLCVKRALWYILYGQDFSSGAVLKYANDVLEYYDPETAAYSYFRWDGVLPHTVAPGTIPDTNAEINWVVVGTQAISSALSGANGANQVGFGTTNVGSAINALTKRLTSAEESMQQQGTIFPELVDALAKQIGAITGFAQIGQVDSWADLPNAIPTVAGQQVMLRGWNKGSTRGYGAFKAVAGAGVSDGGMICAVNDKFHWERVIDCSHVNIFHFGAIDDGRTDAIPAMVAMHNWSVKQAQSQGLAGAYAIGIMVPEGKYAVSSMNLGDAEISAFKLLGPHVELGVLPKTTLVPISLTTTTPVFTFRARRMEVRGFQWLATGSVQPLLVNNVTRGSYVRIKNIVAQKVGGRVFQVKDTLDTKIDQVYSYDGKAAFFRSTWSNEEPGGWNHSTAIELTNFNFSRHTGEPAFDAMRATQSLMTNGWFDHCENSFDISQGEWTMYRVIQEGATNASMTKWAKITEIDCRWAQGAGMDDTLSRYVGSMDLNGAPPPSVTNAFDQGSVEINPVGVQVDAAFSSRFNYSLSTIKNETNADTWYVIGRLTMPRLGDSAIMRVVGASNWDSAQGDMIRPTGTGFGAGTSFIALEMKDPTNESTSRVEAHWWNEDNGPLSDVKITHTWQTITIYGRMRQYARYGAVYMDTTGIPRLKTGNPTYFRPDLSAITDGALAAVPKLTPVPSRKTWNKGQYDASGMGMDFDIGQLVIWQKNRVIENAQEWMSVMLNGNQRYIPVSETTFGQRLTRHTRAEMASQSPADQVWRQVMVTDLGTGTGTKAGMVYSDGFNWVDAATNSVVYFR